MALGSDVLATKELTRTIDEVSEYIPVTFDEPISVTSMQRCQPLFGGFQIEANKRYTASVAVTGLTKAYYGSSRTASTKVSTKKGDVVFDFIQIAPSTNRNFDPGQVPQILFRI